MTVHDSSPSAERGQRDWLAALLLRQPDRFMPRMAAALTRWRALSRNSRRRWQRKVAATAAGAALILAMAGSSLLVPAVHAAGITVDGVTCNLVDAVLSAEFDNSYGGCAPGSGADTISLTTDVTLTAAYGFTYGSDTGLPTVMTTITIEGNGHTIERDLAAPNFRLLAIGSTGDLTINDTTLSGGRTTDEGGGIFNFYGSLTLNNSTLSDNETLYYEFGGGVYNRAGTVTISDSTFSDNYAMDEGGAIAHFNGMVTINNSTFSGNTAGDDGGAIVNYYGTMEINNSTFSGNTAGFGGAIYNDAYLTIRNSTFTGNSASFGGAIANYDPLTISRSVISGNSASGYGDEVYSFYFITSDNNNVFGDAGKAGSDAFVNLTPGVSDIDASSDAGNIPLAAILDTTLTDNGGPTLTHNLVAGSPALDLAPDADCAAAPVSGLDQRGAARSFDVVGTGNDGADTCDAGAVEFNSPVPGETAVFMSTRKPGITSDSLPFGSQDILKWDGSSWSKWFDGSAAGLTPSGKWKHDVNAFWIPDPAGDDVVISFTQNARIVPGIGPAKVDGMDLVWWDGSAFSLWFDGQDVGLTNKTQEKIDSLHVLPGSASPIGGGCLNYLLISTQGGGRVMNFDGSSLPFRGEDVLGFCMTNAGDNTTGLWHMVLDGSAVGMPPFSTDSISVSADGQTMYLTTRGAFNVPPAVGGPSMVYAYDFGTQTFSGPLFDAAANGLPEFVDALQVEGDLN